MIGFAVGLLAVGGAVAQDDLQAPEVAAAAPPTSKNSYEARQLNRRDVHEIDPNIYAYTTDFARRFQMPEAWIVPDLQGAESIAFRMTPANKTCGWGGNTTACRDDEMTCSIDVYFDHIKQPLPWDDRSVPRELDVAGTSAGFISSFANPFYRPKLEFPLGFTPFRDPASGKALDWRVGASGVGLRGGGALTFLKAYDKEIFKGMSLLVIHSPCTGSSLPEYLWLGTGGFDFSERLKSKHLVSLSTPWRLRVKEMLEAYDEKSRAFYRQEGQKVLNALRMRQINLIAPPMPQ